MYVDVCLDFKQKVLWKFTEFLNLQVVYTVYDCNVNHCNEVYGSSGVFLKS